MSGEDSEVISSAKFSMSGFFDMWDSSWSVFMMMKLCSLMFPCEKSSKEGNNSAFLMFIV